VSSGHVRSIKILSETVAGRPGSEHRGAPGRALLQRRARASCRSDVRSSNGRAAHHRGVQHTAIAASAAGACRVGRYRGQRGLAPLNPSNSVQRRASRAAQHKTTNAHAACQVAPSSGCNGLCPVQHSTWVVAGGRLGGSANLKAKTRTQAHARARMCARTHRHTLTYKSGRATRWQRKPQSKNTHARACTLADTHACARTHCHTLTYKARHTRAQTAHAHAN
jgi:hypothetical protein